MTERSDRPTARDRAQAIVRDYLAGHFEIEGAAERIIDAILAAERAAADRQREACAKSVRSLSTMPSAYEDAVRLTPLEVDDVE